jgi:hypothetical protein
LPPLIVGALVDVARPINRYWTASDVPPHQYHRYEPYMIGVHVLAVPSSASILVPPVTVIAVAVPPS